MASQKQENPSKEQDVDHLFGALRKGKAHLARFILAASKNGLLNCWNAEGRTPLIECCYIKEEGTRDRMVRILKEAGADINMSDRHGWTPLIHACEQRCNDLVRIFVHFNHINPDKEDVDGNTALLHAATIGNDVATEILVRNFRRLGLQVDHFNKEGYTAIHMAARQGFLSCARLLAVSGRASLTLKDKVLKLTPLEWALKLGYQKSEVDFLKPRDKFYRVAKLTTTMAKYHRSVTSMEDSSEDLKGHDHEKSPKKSQTSLHPKENNSEDSPTSSHDSTPKKSTSTPRRKTTPKAVASGHLAKGTKMRFKQMSKKSKSFETSLAARDGVRQNKGKKNESLRQLKSLDISLESSTGDENKEIENFSQELGLLRVHKNSSENNDSTRKELAIIEGACNDSTSTDKDELSAFEAFSGHMLNSVEEIEGCGTGSYKSAAAFKRKANNPACSSFDSIIHGGESYSEINGTNGSFKKS